MMIYLFCTIILGIILAVFTERRQKRKYNKLMQEYEKNEKVFTFFDIDQINNLKELMSVTTPQTKEVVLNNLRCRLANYSNQNSELISRRESYSSKINNNLRIKKCYIKSTKHDIKYQLSYKERYNETPKQELHIKPSNKLVNCLQYQ